VSLGILGNKVGMTQIFDKNGFAFPATVIKVGPCFVTQIKSEETCGYNAVQLGYLDGSKKTINLSKPEKGHLKRKNLPLLNYLREYKTENINNYKIGDQVTIDVLENKEVVNITGFTIGKGFAGNVKRNHFNTGAMTHGSKHHRLQGSLGAGTTPARVFPGKKMSGRLGNEKRTIKNLKILEINKEHNLLVVKGSIPGKTGNVVNISY
jgi:large subunit ribosomal protein L3